MRKNRYLWVGLVLTLVCMPVFGQEFTKRTQLYKSEGMIIRDYIGDSWLVYNRYYEYDGSKRNVFILFTETGTTAGMMYLPELVACVNDFEIYDKTAYFAGCNTDGVGIMGYFDLTTFPTTTVKICPVPVMATFERLDVGVCNNTLHVFLTGEEVLGGGHMADARLVGTDQWRFEISVNTALVDRFDDVAVLSSGVAFSGRKTADKDGFIFLFPTLSMSPSIFSAAANYLYFTPSVMGRILLSAGAGGDFAYAFQSTSDIDEVGFLNGTTLIQRYNMGTVPNTYRTIDLSHGQMGNRAELMMSDNGLYAKEIFSANSTSGFTPVPIPPFPGHAFLDEQMHSLDAVGGTGGLYVAAGVGAYDGNLAIYRYNRNNWPDQVCTEYTSLPVGIPDFKVFKYKQKFEGRGFDIEAIEEECLEATIPVVTTCSEDRTDR